jgi:hypothetical protein
MYLYRYVSMFNHGFCRHHCKHVPWHRMGTYLVLIYKIITILTNRQRHRRRREQTKERIRIGEGIITRKYEEREATQFFWEERYVGATKK